MSGATNRRRGRPRADDPPPDVVQRKRVRSRGRPLPAPITITESLAFIDSVSLSLDIHIAERMTFSDVALPELVIEVTEELTFNDAIDEMIDVTFHIDEVLAIQDGLVRIRSGNESACDDAVNTSLGTRDYVTLTWPYAAPTLTLDLRIPKFGNGHTIISNARYQRTRSGQLNVVRPSTWPTVQTLKVSVDALSEDTIEAFRDFIKQSAAFEVGYLDHEARQWRGVVVNPVVPTAQVGIGCQYELSFEFRGRLA